MVKPFDLKEFAENLRVSGAGREAEFATEILDLLDLEEEVPEPYSTLCDDLEWKAPEALKGKPEKIVEWLGDRSDLLEEIEKELTEAGREPEGTNDTADAVKELLETMEQAEAILETAGWPGDGDFIDALQALADRAAKAPPEMEYDL